MNPSRSSSTIRYMAHDWPDSMRMTEEAFAEFSVRQEEEDFEDDVRNLSCSLHQLVVAREDTIAKLRQSADYLDSVWYGCRVSKGVGTSASVVGGGLTIAGGILTIATAGAAAPLLIAGIATSSVGAATNIGTSVVEKTISSKEVRSMSNALAMDKDFALKLESQIERLRRFKDSLHLGALLALAETLLGKTHLVVAILHSVFAFDSTGLMSLSAKFFSAGVRGFIAALSDDIPQKSRSMQDLVLGGAAIAERANVPELLPPSGENGMAVAVTAAAGITATGAAVVAASSTVKDCSSSSTVCKQAGAQLKYNPLGPEIFLETGKVVGQNSTRLAGKVIVGVSAAFLVWDAVDLGLTINDLIRKKGSQAGKILRDKANELEEALSEAKEKFSLQFPN